MRIWRERPRIEVDAASFVEGLSHWPSTAGRAPAVGRILRSPALSRADPLDAVSQPQLCPTIFHEPWWLERACDGAYREALVVRGGMIVGRLPYLLSRRFFGVNVLGMPTMTHVLGPALLADVAGHTPSVSRNVSITRELIAQLPRALHVSFRLHGGVTNTLAFDVAGFSNSAGFTVEIPPGPPERLWLQMRDKTRNVIRRAQERLTVGEALDPELFVDFYANNLRERGVRNHYDPSVCIRVMAECLRRDSGRFLAAYDASGRMQAAIFTVWDRHAEYYFMSTRTQTSINGAVSLILWKAIQHAAEKGLTFDMDNVHVRNHRIPNLHLLTGFGGALKPRYIVQRTSAAARFARSVWYF